MPGKKTSPAGKLKICKNGHSFYKSSDCPVCPVCERERKPSSGYLSLLSAPARRALENKGISSLKQLSTFSENEILALHGIGPSTLPTLRAELKKESLAFKTYASGRYKYSKK